MRLGRSRRRLWAGVAAVCLLLSVVVVRLVWLQGMDAGGYALASSDEKREFTTLHAARGSIVDRNGVPLAYTADAKDIVADPTMVPAGDRLDYATMLAPLIGKSVIAIADQLTSPSRYSLLATALSPAAAKQIEDLRLGGKPLAGIFAQATSQRLYPGKTTGANVIGLV